MKLQTTVAGSSALTLAFLVTACTYLPVSSSGTGFELAGRFSDQIERSKIAIANGEEQLDATMDTLSGIMTEPEQDVRAAWKQLEKDIGQLQKQVDAIEAQNVRMRQQADVYFQSWETELATIESAEMQQRSQVRRSEQMAEFQRTETALSDARNAFDPLFTDLKDLKQYLSIDVTPAGRAAVSDLHDQAGRNADEVKLAISLAMDELDRMQSVLSPGAAAPEDA
jgi:chromosome segregation ATPase